MPCCGGLGFFHLTAQTASGRYVCLAGVVHHHSVGTKSPGQGADAAHHHLDPLPWEPVPVSIVVGGYNGLFQGLIQVIRVAFVGDAVIGVTGPFPDRKSIGAVVSLSPPTVENAAVETSVEDRLLTARSRSLEWATRIVKPHVDSLDQVTTNVDVVVFDKDDAASKSRIVSQVRNLLYKAFARFVFGVGFPCEDDLQRAIGAIEQSRDAIQILEQKIRSLVGSETATKPDGQDVRAQYIACCFDNVIAFTSSAALARNTASHEGKEQILQSIVRFPELARIDLVDVLPYIGLSHLRLPVRWEMSIVKLLHLPCEPAFDVNTVGDMTDWNVSLFTMWPKTLPHASRNVSVQLADRVGLTRHLEPDNGHAEGFAVIISMDSPQPHKVFGTQAQRVSQRA